MTTTPLRVHGVDISHHQDGPIDYDKLKKAGVRWMYHKATEGATVKDENYARRRVEAKAADLPFGAYHFARPSGSDAVTEARFFIKTAKPIPGDLRPCLDLETKEFIHGPSLVVWADDFCDEVERLTGVIPVVYTPYILSTRLEKKALFWVPRYNNDNKPPTRPWNIWQFSNGELGVPNSVPGLGHVDLNHSKVPVFELMIAPPLTSRGVNVDIAIGKLKEAEKRSREGTVRDTLLDRALRIVKKIKPIR